MKRLNNYKRDFDLTNNRDIYVESPNKYSEKIQELRIKCKCGHSVNMPVYVSNNICSWCGRKIINNSKERFKYMLKKKMEEENENIKKRI